MVDICEECGGTLLDGYVVVVSKIKNRRLCIECVGKMVDNTSMGWDNGEEL